jgi:hypothetical protein
MAFGDDLMHLFPNATRVARADNLSWVERQQPIRTASLNAQILSHWLANALREIEGLCTVHKFTREDRFGWQLITVSVPACAVRVAPQPRVHLPT